MKSSTKSFAVLAAALSLPCVALAEMVGGHLPVVVTAENLISVFSIVSLGVIAGADYSRRDRVRRAGGRAACGRATPESHRLAA